MVRIVSLSVLTTLIVILGLTFFQVLAPFLLPLFLAGMFAILCQPLYRYFRRKTGQRVRTAAALTTGTTVLIILIPLMMITVLSSLQLYVVSTKLHDRNWTRTFRERTDPLLEHVADFLNRGLRERVISVDSESVAEDAEPAPSAAEENRPPAPLLAEDVSTPPATDDQLTRAGTESSARPQEDVAVVKYTPERLRNILQVWGRATLLSIGEKSLGTAGRTLTGTLDILSGAAFAIVRAVIGFFVFVIALYYFFADGTALLAATEKLIPVHAKYQRQVLDQFARVVRAVVMATLFAALVQGFATVFALWLLGFEQLLVLLVLCILSALIPLMGTWLVWGSCALWLLWNGHWIQATLLALYGMVIVGVLDNVVRTYVLNTDTKLHPLLALISVLGGLQAMGLWGIFIGPIVASCLHALVQIFNHELAAYSQERLALATPAPGGPPARAESSSRARLEPAAEDLREPAPPRPAQTGTPKEKQSMPTSKPPS
jgi:predicted PurR-regulated permease PerM